MRVQIFPEPKHSSPYYIDSKGSKIKNGPFVYLVRTSPFHGGKGGSNPPRVKVRPSVRLLLEFVKNCLFLFLYGTTIGF